MLRLGRRIGGFAFYLRVRGLGGGKGSVELGFCWIYGDLVLIWLCGMSVRCSQYVWVVEWDGMDGMDGMVVDIYLNKGLI